MTENGGLPSPLQPPSGSSTSPDDLERPCCESSQEIPSINMMLSLQRGRQNLPLKKRAFYFQPEPGEVLGKEEQAIPLRENSSEVRSQPELPISQMEESRGEIDLNTSETCSKPTQKISQLETSSMDIIIQEPLEIHDRSMKATNQEREEIQTRSKEVTNQEPEEIQSRSIEVTNQELGEIQTRSIEVTNQEPGEIQTRSIEVSNQEPEEIQTRSIEVSNQEPDNIQARSPQATSGPEESVEEIDPDQNKIATSPCPDKDLPSDTSGEEDPRFVIEKVLKIVKFEGRLEYFIKWANYPDSANSFIYAEYFDSEETRLRLCAGLKEYDYNPLDKILAERVVQSKPGQRRTQRTTATGQQLKEYQVTWKNSKNKTWIKEEDFDSKITFNQLYNDMLERKNKKSKKNKRPRDSDQQGPSSKRKASRETPQRKGREKARKSMKTNKEVAPGKAYLRRVTKDFEICKGNLNMQSTKIDADDLISASTSNSMQEQNRNSNRVEAPPSRRLLGNLTADSDHGPPMVTTVQTEDPNDEESPNFSLKCTEDNQGASKDSPTPDTENLVDRSSTVSTIQMEKSEDLPCPYPKCDDLQDTFEDSPWPSNNTEDLDDGSSSSVPTSQMENLEDAPLANLQREKDWLEMAFEDSSRSSSNTEDLVDVSFLVRTIEIDNLEDVRLANLRNEEDALQRTSEDSPWQSTNTDDLDDGSSPVPTSQMENLEDAPLANLQREEDGLERTSEDSPRSNNNTEDLDDEWSSSVRTIQMGNSEDVPHANPQSEEDDVQRSTVNSPSPRSDSDDTDWSEYEEDPDAFPNCVSVGNILTHENCGENVINYKLQYKTLPFPVNVSTLLLPEIPRFYEAVEKYNRKHGIHIVLPSK